MANTGPKRNPRLRALAGVDDKNLHDSVYRAAPDPPDGLSLQALEVFERTVQQLDRVQLLTKADGPALTVAARTAIRQQADRGNVLPGDNSEPWERDPLRDPDDAARYRGDPWSVVRGDGKVNASASELRGRAKSAVEAVGMTDEWRENVTQMIERDDRDGRISQTILATTNPSYEKSFNLILRGDKELLTQDEILATRR